MLSASVEPVLCILQPWSLTPKCKIATNEAAYVLPLASSTVPCQLLQAIRDKDVVPYCVCTLAGLLGDGGHVKVSASKTIWKRRLEKRRI